MDWSELDALADELRRTVARGSLHNNPSMLSDRTHTLTVERQARIALADVDHVRAWERSHAWDRASERRRQQLGEDILRLLDLATSSPPPL